MKTIDFLVNLFMPRRCLFCSDVIGFLPQCPECSKTIKEVTRESGIAVEEKALQKIYYKTALAPFVYAGCVRRGIISMKYGNNANKAREFAQFMVQELKACNMYDDFDIIVSVPSTRKSKRERGYDVPHLLAKEISKQTGINYTKSALRKIFNTEKQSRLTALQRKTNVVGAFEHNEHKNIIGKRILLVDDIITTGTTLNECAKELLFAQAQSVCVICIAATAPNRIEE